MKAKMTLVTILFGLSSLAGAADGQSGNTIASRLLAGREGVSAISLAVIRDGKVALCGWAGVRGDASRGKVDGRTLFRACSLTKPLFAYLVLRLVEEGVLALDQPLQEVLGTPIGELDEYRDVAGDPRLGALTARLALSHRSGFPNWRWQRPDKKLAFEFAPGSSFAYSGEGYLLLQRVIERKTGRSLEPLCRQYVFEPLAMKASKLRVDDDNSRRLSFDVGKLPPFFQEKMRNHSDAAGSLLTNAADYALFLQAVIDGKGLGRPLAEAMRQPQVAMTRKSLFGPGAGQPDEGRDNGGLAWCLGWIGAKGPRGEMFFHVGSEGWFENFAVFFPQRREGMVLFCSGENPAGLVRDAVRLVFGTTGLPFDWMGY